MTEDYRLKHVWEWLEIIRERGIELTEWETNFIQSCYDQWERKRTLSEKQIDIIERIYTEKTA